MLDTRARCSSYPGHPAVQAEDGRVSRLVKSLNKLSIDSETDLLALRDFFCNGATCVWDDPTSREKTKREAAMIQKQATKLVAQQRIALKRFNNVTPSAQVGAARAKAQLDSNMGWLDAIHNFLYLLMQQPPAR